MTAWFKPLKTDNRKRSLMALLGGVAAIGIAKSVSAQTPAVPLGPSVGNLGGGNPGGSSGQLQFNNSGAFGGYGIGSGLSVAAGNLIAVGGTGLPSVASVAALQAVATSAAVVYLNAGGLSGNFAWNSANLSTQVTNDPGQGITIAPNSDTTGASGAWVRQFNGVVNWQWWGNVGDGATANATAMANFGTWARYWTSLGLAVDVIVPPGTYLFDNANCQRWLAGIAQLHMKGYGATFQNNTTNGSWELPWELAALPIDQGGTYLAWPINATTVGATSFTLTTPTNAANLTVGAYTMLGSLDTQYFGYPPNMDQFEFLKITSVNASTGVVGVDRPIRYAHLTTYPDGVALPPCGAARVWQLNTTNTINGITGVTPFDVQHVYEGLTVLSPTATALGKLTMTGRSITWLNANIIAVSPSIAQNVSLLNCVVPGSNSEPDKLVESFYCRDTTFIQNLPLQSNSIDRVTLQNCKVGGLLTTGGKLFTAKESEIEQLIPGGAGFGVNRATIIDACTVREYTPPAFQVGAGGVLAFGTITATAAASWTTSSTTITLAANPGTVGVDLLVYDTTTNLPIGSVASVVGTTLTLNAAAVNASSGSSDGLSFGNAYYNGLITMPLVNVTNMQPGMALVLAASGNSYPGDIGAGVVTAITGDANFLYVQTTLQFTNLPSWNNGNAYLQRRPQFTVRNSTGCDNIRRASAATAAGYQEGQYALDYLIGQGSASGHFKDYGVPLSLSIDVRIASTVSGAKLTLTLLMLSASAPATSENLVAVIDLTTIGLRVINQTSFIGQQSADSLTFNSAAVGAIPVGWVLNGNAWPSWQLNYTPSSDTLQQMPTVKIQRLLDTGLYGDVLTANQDPSGATLIATTGGLL
jgi:hypothetical protein